MEKEEILFENYKELKENLTELKRNLVFVQDVYAQKLEEIEEEVGHKVFELKETKLYKSFEEEIEELKQKIKNCLKDFNFNSSYDVYKTCVNAFETIESDLNLVNAFPLRQSFVKKQISEVFLFNLASLGISKLQIGVMLDAIDDLLSKTKDLINKNA
ncbi:MAG: hypothetical protein ACI4TI_02180 [Christensenellales bacterium]